MQLEQITIVIYAPVTQIGPNPAHRCRAAQVYFYQNVLRGVGTGAVKDFPLRPGNEAGAPKINALAPRWPFFIANPIDRQHRDSVGDSVGALDRKSTRLNSSHVAISYAVFCLKK